MQATQYEVRVDELKVRVICELLLVDAHSIVAVRFYTRLSITFYS